MATHTFNAIDTLHHADVCAGGSGLGLALKIVFGERVRTVLQLEREAYAAATLVARMEDQTLDPAPVWDQVESFSGKAWYRRVDILTAGFPCQPFSLAGKREGTRDERWIWDDIVRIIREFRCPLVYLENVPGLTLTDRDGEGWALPAGLWHVLGDLAALGFDAEWICVRAEDVGASHERARIFILGYSRDFARLQKYGSARSLQPKGSQAETHRGSNESDNELEHTAGERSGLYSERRENTEPRSEPVGHATSNNERGHSNGAHGPRQPAGGPVGAVVNPESLDRRGQQQSGVKKRRRVRPTGSHTEVGHAGRARRQQVTAGASGDETEHAWRATVSNHEPQRADESMGNTESRRCSDQSASQGPVHEWAGSGGADAELDDAASGGTGPVPAGWRGDRSGETDAGWSGESMEHTALPAPERQQSQRIDLPGATSATVGHATTAGREKRARERGNDGQELETFERSGLPIFPPGPGLGGYGVIDDIRELFRTDARAAWQRYQAELRNTLEWCRILEEYPALEPAVQYVADELSARVGERTSASRVDQLRLMGGAVVPTAAAVAFCILAHRLGIEL